MPLTTALIQQAKRQILRLHRNRKAISVVVGTVVLTAAVLAMGIAVMYWAQSMGKIANREYSKAVADNSNAVLERLSFEHASYAGNQLNVYVINSGQANLTVVRAYLWNSSSVAIGTYSVERNTLRLTLVEGGPFLNSSINVGNERCIRIGETLPAGTYSVRIVTQRGRNFDSTFSIP